MTRAPRIAVVGSRPPKDDDETDENIALFAGVLDAVRAWIVARAKEGRFTLVSGGAIGVDELAEETAKRLGLSRIVVTPDYRAHGSKDAPLKRNAILAATADQMVAFVSPWSRGTRNAVGHMQRLGKPVEVIG